MAQLPSSGPSLPLFVLKTNFLPTRLLYYALEQKDVSMPPLRNVMSGQADFLQLGSCLSQPIQMSRTALGTLFSSPSFTITWSVFFCCGCTHTSQASYLCATLLSFSG